MKKYIILALSVFAISAQAADWDKPSTSTKALKAFVTQEVGGRSSVKFQEIQQDKDSKKQVFRLFAVVENSYVPDEGDIQKAISCDTIVVSKEKTGYQIISWTKNDCDIEDIIYLKQK